MFSKGLLFPCPAVSFEWNYFYLVVNLYEILPSRKLKMDVFLGYSLVDFTLDFTQIYLFIFSAFTKDSYNISVLKENVNSVEWRLQKIFLSAQSFRSLYRHLYHLYQELGV